MYSARLMLAWLPTGSGAPKESAYGTAVRILLPPARHCYHPILPYPGESRKPAMSQIFDLEQALPNIFAGPFLQALTDGARAHRRARAIIYEVQRTEREHRVVAAELDGARLERLKYHRPRTVPHYLDVALQDLNEGFRSRTVKLEQLRPRVEAAKKEARAIAVRVYALAPSVTNAVFRPDPPDIPIGLHTSPRLFGMLRGSKEAHWLLLEDDRKQEQLAASGVRRSAARLKEAAARVQHLIDLAERGEHMTESEMPSIAALQREIETHRIALENWSVSKARTERRDLDQWLYEEEMFLDVVAPVLEADGRIAEDRLRSSNLGRDQSGERRVFQRGPDPSPLTPDQENHYFVSFDVWWDECDKHAAVLARLNEQWAEVLQSLGTDQSVANSRLREEWEEDCRVAQERLIEAQRYLRQRSYELVDRCAVPPLFEFFDDPEGQKDSEPTTEERLRSGEPDMDAVDRWKALVWESHPPPSAITQGFLDSWPWKPLELGEPGAYDGYWLEEDEKWFRDRLIRNSNNVSEEIRLGMAIAGSSRMTRLLQSFGLIRPQL
ncbi:hypothetical protein LTR10_004512 [Elasticomyces elasticus]|nr:hypothetical protein LTR10_004512 [Elasticomyces elasticus]KAK4976831.1 hypothetical protein LTR42_002876 [Elasticomyces elasticus]